MKTKIHALFIALLLTLMSAVAFGQLIPQKVPLGTEKGAVYGYWQTVPKDPATIKGILFFIHGHGERGNGSSVELDKVSRIGIQKLIYQAKWNRQEFIVISAQYPVTADKMAAKTLKGFIYHTCQKFNIDTTKVYMLGISGGGITVLNYIVTYPTVKAAVELSGSGSPSKAYRSISTRLWAFHGDADYVVNTSGSVLFVNAYNAAKPAVQARLTLFPFEGHSPYVWDTVCKQDAVYEWMLKQ